MSTLQQPILSVPLPCSNGSGLIPVRLTRLSLRPINGIKGCAFVELQVQQREKLNCPKLFAALYDAWGLIE